MLRLLRALLISALSMLVVLAPGVALAHDELIGSSPSAGETVGTAQELVLRFSGPIADIGAQVEVTGEDGSTVISGTPQIEGAELVQPLADDLAGGDYEVVWRVTSSDGHPISGTFGFSVEAADAAGTAEETTGQAAQEATEQETTEPETTEPATAAESPAATEQQAPAATTPGNPATTPAATPESSEEAVGGAEGGVPVWAWVVVGLAVLGLVGLLARTWSRGRS